MTPRTPTFSRLYVKLPGTTGWRPVDLDTGTIAQVFDTASVVGAGERERIQADINDGRAPFVHSSGAPGDHKFMACGW